MIAVATRFNCAINAQDIEVLAGRMTDDHSFVDTADTAVSGKAACVDAWRGFFQAYPDYRNVFDSVTAYGDVAVAFGHSVCSEPTLAGPAIWAATIRDDLVAQWRVYLDTQETRERLQV